MLCANQRICLGVAKQIRQLSCSTSQTGKSCGNSACGQARTAFDVATTCRGQNPASAKDNYRCPSLMYLYCLHLSVPRIFDVLFPTCSSKCRAAPTRHGLRLIIREGVLSQMQSQEQPMTCRRFCGCRKRCRNQFSPIPVLEFEISSAPNQSPTNPCLP